MKLTGAKAVSYFSKPDLSHCAILIYGADAMRVGLRRQELLKSLVGTKAEEEMRLTRISGADLRKEPSLILDSLKSIGFFPGPRAVFVETAADGVSSIIEGAIKEWREGDACLVVTAGQLNARSKLRKVFEGPQNTVAIGIFNDPVSDDEIISLAVKSKLTNFFGEAKKDLLSLGRSLDPGDLNQMLEKLSLYKYNDDTPITSEDIEACTPATIDVGLDEVIHIMADAKSAEVSPILNRLFGQGVNPTTMCISATRHFRNLHLAATHPSGADIALSRARPPVFGFRKDRMVRQARSWGSSRLEKALSVLMDTDLSLRSSSKIPEQAMLERAFIRISMMRPK
ncbi:MAG: DNA polymerase III subunit delta [Amylibacter sp.]|mgnify:CR=1 FL=1|nr:DNA polymerase III subunit delta [Amylibacter sp.]